MGLPTALVCSKAFELHQTVAGHPERPSRARTVYQSLVELPDTPNVLWCEPQAAAREDILRVHADEYIERFEAACRSDAEEFGYPDCSISRDSFDIAMLAAGTGIQMVQGIKKGRFRNGFAAIRPPGHHAEYDRALGFCFFNTIAVTAAYLLERCEVSRLMILDWDVHHGNGTQRCFYRDPRVLFCSLHQHPLTIFPGSGFASEQGEAEGEGYTLNIPLLPRSTLDAYRQAMQEVRARASVFRPEWLLLSCGFDAHREDSLSDIRLEDEDFRYLTRETRAIAEEQCEGRLLSFLEGGYSLDVLSRCVPIHIEELSREPTLRD